MWLLLISALHVPCSSGGNEYDRHSGRALAFKEKVASSSPHVVGVTEDILATEEATVL